MKTQGIRLMDVFLLGPFMVWFGASAKSMPVWARTTMVLAGIGTSVYNGVNYLRVQAGGA